jgi:mono/diheme cytochrome c family protein
MTVVGAGADFATAQTFDLTDLSGEELFQQFCSACHGDSGRGDGPVAQTLNVLVPDLTRLSERRDGDFPAAEIRETIDGRSLIVAHGTRTMPVWGYEFWIEEGADAPAESDARELIDRLVRYVRDLQRDSDPARVRSER